MCIRDRRTFTVENNTVSWGEPYLLRTVLNAEQDSSRDGVYANGTLPESLPSSPAGKYTDAYLANVSFLTAKLGDKLPEGETGTFEPFSLTNDGVEEETFLLFEMNGNTYVIRQSSLESITDPEGDNSGTINPFFTYDQVYGDAIQEGSTENLSSGKSEVVIGADGDGNVAAVYTSSVPSTVNNAIYISYWDPVDGSWSSGVMLAMNNMDVYERSIAQGWDDATTEDAYFDEGQDSDNYAGGANTQLLFSNLQIALGRRAAGSGQAETGGVDAGISSIGSNGAAGSSAQVTEESASATFSKVIDALGIPNATVTDENGQATTQISLNGYEATATSPFSASALLSGSAAAQQYAVLEQAELMGVDTGARTSPTSELLILTQGALQELEERTVSGSSETVIVPKDSDEDGVADRAKVGLYAISYGKGEQQVGNAYIQFAYDEFTAGSELYATVSFANVGDSAIRGSADQRITVKLMVHIDGGTDQELTKWTIAENVAAGQTVHLATDQQPCTALTQNLGEQDYFYLTVSEDTSGYVTDPYTYNSSDGDDPGYYVRLVESRPELGVENLTASASGVEQNGDVAVDVSFDVTNRGDALAEDVFVQFTYLDHYDADGQPVYEPLNITGSDLFVSQEQVITSGIQLMSAKDNNYSIGVIMLDTDDTYYTSDYYISAEDYNAILAQYYSTSEVSGWEHGTYNGVNYWYDGNYYGSAYAAYTAGQEAVAHWLPGTGEGAGYYYSDQYDSFGAAKAAADAARKAEYILTETQYNALSESEQSAWKEVTDTENNTVYIPVSYTDYAAAEAAYLAAMNATGPQIRADYLRTVEGTLYVDPDLFKERATGSLGLRVEVFSRSSNANIKAGLYTSDHSDEYYAINNQAEAQVEQKSFIAAADRVVLGQYGAHRLAVSIRTTTGEAPSIRVLEVGDDHDELGTLSFTPNTDTDGVSSTLTGYLTVVGNELGEGVIHIVDDATNTTCLLYTSPSPRD